MARSLHSDTLQQQFTEMTRKILHVTLLEVQKKMLNGLRMLNVSIEYVYITTVNEMCKLIAYDNHVDDTKIH